MEKFGMGQPAARVEDERLLTGKGRYLDDVNLPGQVWGVFVRSPHAHARIKSLDAAAGFGHGGGQTPMDVDESVALQQTAADHRLVGQDYHTYAGALEVSKRLEHARKEFELRP